MSLACIPSDILHFAGNHEAAWRVLDTFKALPEAFRGPVKSRYTRAAMEGGREAAKSYISQAEADLCRAPLSLAAGDAEICDYARQRANEVRSLLMAQTGAGTAADLRATLAGYCLAFGATVPPGVLLAGLVGRMTDAAWWRRQVRRNHARQVEAHAIGHGFVHRRAGLYASDEAVARHGAQQKRNAEALQATEATNEAGLTMTLAELAAVSVANPRIRRGELMTRIAGFESYAKAAGHVGMFYTGTAPSRMHPRLAKTGQENPKFDGTTPKECAGYLSKLWARARAWLHRRGLAIYGFRVAEPHHDGTPHWHMLFFMAPEIVGMVTDCLTSYFRAEDAGELETEKARAARFTAVAIDWRRGSAAGYISKYIAKNIDGLRNDETPAGDDFEAVEPTAADKTAPRVLAWASTWGIRQFQQIGGPGVGVWRELRKLRDMPQGDLFDTWAAADAGNWHAFTERQGGAVCRRDARPVQLWKEVPAEAVDFHGEIQPARNKYGELVGPAVVGVYLRRPVLGECAAKTRVHTWEIRRATNAEKSSGAGKSASRAGERKGVAGFGRADGDGAGRGRGCGFEVGAQRPWSPVNNCTPVADADGFKIGAPLPAPDAAPVDTAPLIKAAQVAAVLANIAGRRKRGAFGQFPQLRE